MEEIVLENEAVYWRGNLVSFSAAHFNKVVITEKRKGRFVLTYGAKSLRIETKAAGGFINGDLCRDMFITLQTDPLSCLLWDIFNAIKNEINKTNDRLNNFVPF